MSGHTIEILPKTSFPILEFAQSPRQSVDIGTFKSGSIQVWADLTAVGASTPTLNVTLQEANLNEETSFVDVTDDSGSPATVTLTNTGSALLGIALKGRFVRVKVSPVDAQCNVRVVLQLNRD